MLKRTLVRLNKIERINLSNASNSRLFNFSNLKSDALSELDKEDFVIYPNYLNIEEQKVLLKQLLKKLDRVCGKPRRNANLQRQHEEQYEEGNLQRAFCHKDMYRWQTSHFDNVITGYREANVRSMTVPNVVSEEGILGILKRLYGCLYDNSTELTKLQANDMKDERLEDDDLSVPKWIQSHILHLSPDGTIQAHVDNQEAMGSTIMGLSLGEERLVEFNNESKGSFLVRLPSGSVYIQKSKLRYEYKHSILQGNCRDQRLSLMLRDQPSPK
ncbi:hypothetical protein E3Q23_01388 [Wallemia mellicola]|uniref:Alpha-ketoglutarate-dependent dioxygenase AlkB-like domain-containing protein n=1 Tax=Wallemia mellicola TaxID=1708541 RepID=A0A4T0TNP9_9BASI|nr:hypothetical protein E3Q23_01388 [Wallemia mellicola]TIC18471.1 hypothetical protein E3Q13_02026 [Wallemia mellicola]TIC21522.1 hypothetical protein E3Q12_03373 [Wallemia mellicola]TIC31817.1 hypothetical protein E3Q09_03916 [Wallemia mellicola]TIC51017.1 hypothetical protein E3Q04_03919 [Wallemia mellicola]